MGGKRTRSRVVPLLLCAASLSVSSLVAASYNDAPYEEGHRGEEDYFADRTHQRGLYDENQQGGGANPWVIGSFSAAGGLLVEWFWTGRALANLRKQFNKDSLEVMQRAETRKELYIDYKQKEYNRYIQEAQEAELVVQQLQAAAIDAGVDVQVSQQQLDYDEFKQPDLNGDNMITKSEFNHYIKTYLQAYPNIRPEDIPRFEDFDLDGNGVVTFSEWQTYLEAQRLQAEKTNNVYGNDLLNGMYETTARSQGFNQLNNNLNQMGGARQARY